MRIDPPVYANRIHADDAASLLAHLLQADHRGVALESCYLGVDDDPAALADVVAWIREYRRDRMVGRRQRAARRQQTL